jgi:glycosyltransferase involved in cell wall biosynthesis
MGPISIVIPLYNKETMVRRAIDSVLAQRDVELELIVVDDGSTDHSREVAQTYGDCIRLSSQQNAGCAAARDAGVTLARYPWVCFLDADDELVPGALASHMRALARFPGARISIGGFRHIGLDGAVMDHNPALLAVHPADRSRLMRLERFSAHAVMGVPTNCVCVARELLATVRFDPLMRGWDSTDFLLRLVLAYPNVVLIPDIVAIVHQTPQGTALFTHNDPANARYFLHKLLAELPRISRRQRRPFVRSVVPGMLALLWQVGDLGDFVALGRRYAPYFFLDTHLHRLAVVSLLPVGVLRRMRCRLRAERQTQRGDATKVKPPSIDIREGM